ncbi:hypothetical protein [Pontimicrobium aquaticum]|uniref:Uncharacterized protein n=1 Tax=Pontimicrobium aquaticum TaxID=2565367 RepID=A0A4U0F067_9FLAO|nr:hypothetical protein [Pontimicrobium aquaticum]TJY37757.1 hypothetical protein E5167_00455 [Pontimicrobium aquaticum]
MKVKSYFKQILLETPSILIAVILAIYLTNWVDNINRQEKANVLVSFIEEEISSNLKALHGVVDSLTNVNVLKYDSLIQLYSQKRISNIPQNSIRPTIKSVAWESARLSDVFSEIPPKKVNQFFLVYQEQKRVEELLKIQDEISVRKLPELTQLQMGKYLRNINEKLSQRYKDLISKYGEYLELEQEDLKNIKIKNRLIFSREIKGKD